MVFAPSGEYHFIVAASWTKPGHAVRVATAPAAEFFRVCKSASVVA